MGAELVYSGRAEFGSTFGIAGVECFIGVRAGAVASTVHGDLSVAYYYGRVAHDLVVVAAYRFKPGCVGWDAVEVRSGVVGDTFLVDQGAGVSDAYRVASVIIVVATGIRNRRFTRLGRFVANRSVEGDEAMA